MEFVIFITTIVIFSVASYVSILLLDRTKIFRCCKRN